jgi:ABC-2 type transport system permease protein
VLGTGLSSLIASNGDVDFRTFLFPGVLATSVLFTAAFSGISMVWDREFGFLREMLVAPVSTTAILTGKCLGGATVATLQSLIILALAGLVGVPYDLAMMVELVGLLFLMAFMICALGLFLSARVKQVQSAMPLVQLTIRTVVFDHLDLTPAAQATFNPGITWAGWHVPVPLQIAIVVATCLILLGLAVARFARTE